MTLADSFFKLRKINPQDTAKITTTILSSTTIIVDSYIVLKCVHETRIKNESTFDIL